ncbi:MAG TPA: hypothetical protein VM888_07610 [Chitinophagaceae bacterium]|jgi:hypothetical protein|nr:hypothetical protein [Chitinophagaceae bacterium]
MNKILNSKKTNSDMGKGRAGKYHPPNGKPSSATKQEGLGVAPTDPEKIDQYLKLTDNYTNDVDEMAIHVHIRHVNRNTQKGK